MPKDPNDFIRATADLVSLPDIYIRVKSVIDDPDSSMSDLTEVVGFDPGLAARLLTLANSAFFGFSAKIDTIDRAVSMLGGRQVHDLVLATTVADAFSRVTPKSITMREFWSGSVHCGLLAKTLASSCGLIDADRFFVEGLLFDIGHLILDQVVPEKCTQAFAEARDKTRPLALIEQDIIGCDYAQVGSALMESWHFPGGFIESVRFQNEPADAQAYPLDASIVHVSTALLRTERETFDGEQICSSLSPFAVEETGLEAEMLDEVVAGAGDELDETMEMLFPRSAQGA